MTGSSPPAEPKKGLPKTLVVIAIVAVVAIAAIAGAYMLMNNPGPNDKNGNGNGNNDKGGDNGKTPISAIANGDYIEIKTTTENDTLSMNSTIRWEVSNVTATGYDITIRINYGLFNQTITHHANLTDVIGTGAVNDNYSIGTLIGIETLSTPIGNKKVEHWRITETDDTNLTVTDYYVGKDTKMVYKLTMVNTDSSYPENNMNYTSVLVATNIESLKNGDKA
jgi:hypothetical protein